MRPKNKNNCHVEPIINEGYDKLCENDISN